LARASSSASSIAARLDLVRVGSDLVQLFPDSAPHGIGNRCKTEKLQMQIQMQMRKCTRTS
jgi:hypothetical protein